MIKRRRCVPIEEAPLATYDPNAVRVEWHPGMPWPPEDPRTEPKTPQLEDQPASSAVYSRTHRNPSRTDRTPRDMELTDSI